MKAAAEGELPVGGWVTQAALFTGACVSLFFGLGDQAAVFVAGSLVVGVMRQIERDRRARERDLSDPPPGSKL